MHNFLSGAVLLIVWGELNHRRCLVIWTEETIEQLEIYEFSLDVDIYRALSMKSSIEERDGTMIGKLLRKSYSKDKSLVIGDLT